MVDSTNISTLSVDDTAAGDKRLTIDAAGKLVLTNQPFEHQVTDAEINENSSISGIVSGSQLLANDNFDGLSSAVAFVTAHPDKLSSLSTASYRTQSECTTLGIDYPDGGGADYVVVGGGTGVADGGSFIDAGSKQIKLIFSSIAVNSSAFGVYNNQPDALGQLVACAKYAKVVGVNKIQLDSNIVLAQDDQITFANIVFCGSGSLEGAYRKFVFSDDFKHNVSVVGSSVPMLSKLTTQKPVAVLVGDSISTFSANTRNRNFMLAGALENKLREEFEGLTFHNRAIGGQTFDNLDGLPSTTNVEWYTNPLTPWMDYIEALEPDILFVSFGMNDSININYDTLKSITSKIEAFNKAPKIIFCTNLTPSLKGSGGGSNATSDDQEGRDYAAGLIRTFANYHNYGLLDFNRQGNISRDGIDVIGGRIGGSEVLFPSGGLLYGTKSCHSFRMQFSINEVFFSPDSSDKIRIPLDDGFRSALEIVNIGGFYRIAVTAATAQGAAETLKVIDTGIALTGTVYKMAVEVVGGIVTIYDTNDNSGANTPAIATFKTIRAGGELIPRAILIPNGVIGGARIDYGNSYITAPTISNDLLWGDPDFDDGTGIKQWGGSSWNHPSNHVLAYVYLPVLSSANFTTLTNRLSADCSDILFADIPVSTAYSTTGSTKYGAEVALPSSGSNGILYSIKKPKVATQLEILYRGDTTSGTDVTAYVAHHKAGTLGAAAAGLLFAGTFTLENNNTEVKSVRINLSEVSIDVNDEVSINRVGNNPNDNYGTFNVIAINLI